MGLRKASAKKKQRQSIKRKERNSFVKTTLKTKTKSLLSLIEEKNTDKASERLKDIISAFDKAATKGVIHKRNASRNISRLSKKVHDLQPAEMSIVDKLKDAVSIDKAAIDKIDKELTILMDKLKDTVSIDKAVIDKIDKEVAKLIDKLKDSVSIDKAVETIAGIGVPALVLFIAVHMSAYTGGAAIISALVAIGLGGMIGGVLSLVALAIISAAIAKYGFNELYQKIIQKFKEQGITTEEILSKIESYPISKEMKLKLKEWVNENWEKIS